jgi:hypothetical protein
VLGLFGRGLEFIRGNKPGKQYDFTQSAAAGARAI